MPDRPSDISPEPAQAKTRKRPRVREELGDIVEQLAKEANVNQADVFNKALDEYIQNHHDLKHDFDFTPTSEVERHLVFVLLEMLRDPKEHNAWLVGTKYGGDSLIENQHRAWKNKLAMEERIKELSDDKKV